MPERRRRLAAILAADVAGYSRLMGDDERATVDTLNAYRAVFRQHIGVRGGRVVDTAGDSVLAVFDSVVEAVECAVAIQAELEGRNSDLPQDRRMLFRIGVNSGDVIEQDDGTIYGDGVNVAARIEALAEPGGTCVSGRVAEEVEGKIALAFHDIGEHEVKNIARPVHAYRLGGEDDPDAKAGDKPKIALPDRPSIAVLPFTNMSGDEEQEYFSDGLTEDLITELSRFPELFVIARNTSFTYKGKAVNVEQMGRELGVRYVLEGSVRKGGNRMRITGQLIDAASGAHIWADRFDGTLDDVFELQDRVTESVIGALQPRLRSAEIERSHRQQPSDLTAYDLYLQALPHTYAMQPDRNEIAVELLEKAVALDPGYAPAAAYCAWCYEQRLTSGWPTATEETPGRLVELARAAIAADSQDANAMAIAGYMLIMVARDYETGHAIVQRALALCPNSAMVSMFAGWANIFAGSADTAKECFERSLRLSPNDPQAFFYLTGIAVACLAERHFAEANDFATKAAGVYPDWDGLWIFKAAAVGHLGRTDEAREAVAKLLALTPGATVSQCRSSFPFRDPARHEIILEGLRQAGLPEGSPEPERPPNTD